MRIYYAHAMPLYNTPQERRDVALLSSLGFAVCNPNDPAVGDVVAERLALGQDYWDVFSNLIEGCQALAFRALPDGRITAGIAKEIRRASDNNLPVIELPWGFVDDRAMSVEATRRYLHEVGQR